MIPAALRYRDFRRVFLAQVISTFGDFFVPVAISFAVLDLTGSVSDLGLVLFARILGQVLLFLAGGVWADRLRASRSWSPPTRCASSARASSASCSSAV